MVVDFVPAGGPCLYLPAGGRSRPHSQDVELDRNRVHHPFAFPRPHPPRHYYGPDLENQGGNLRRGVRVEETMSMKSSVLSAMGRRTAVPPISWLMKAALTRPKLISLAAGFTDSATLPARISKE